MLLQPRLLVKNQQESRIFVGSEEPYLTTFFDDTNNNSSRSSVTQSTVTSGLTFEVTPSISNSYLIELELKIDNDEANPQDLPNPNGDGTVRVVGRDRQQVER
ncbi:MAG: type II and III secretion system protein [Candidatus Competibacteraceae bacterium]|nr:type II and III secretion system protein [Candidatus Competibacteraceae bacterium]